MKKLFFFMLLASMASTLFSQTVITRFESETPDQEETEPFVFIGPQYVGMSYTQIYDYDEPSEGFDPHGMYFDGWASSTPWNLNSSPTEENLGLEMNQLSDGTYITSFRSRADFTTANYTSFEATWRTLKDDDTLEESWIASTISPAHSYRDASSNIHYLVMFRASSTNRLLYLKRNQDGTYNSAESIKWDNGLRYREFSLTVGPGNQEYIVYRLNNDLILRRPDNTTITIASGLDENNGTNWAN